MVCGMLDPVDAHVPSLYSFLHPSVTRKSAVTLITPPNTASLMFYLNSPDYLSKTALVLYW